MPLAKLSAALFVLAALAFVLAGAMLHQWAFYGVACMFVAVAVLMLAVARRGT